MSTADNIFFVNHNYGGSLSECGHNVGNKLIQHAIFQLILGHIPSTFHGINNIWTIRSDELTIMADYVNANFRMTVWNLQDQIRPSISYYGSETDTIFGNVDAFLSLLTIPVLAIGLGINWFEGVETIDRLPDELTPNCKRFVQTLSSKTRCIGIRGRLTEYILQKLGVSNTFVIGCPTMCVPRLPWRQSDNAPIRVLTNIPAMIPESASDNMIFSFIQQDSYDNFHTTRDDITTHDAMFDIAEWEHFTRSHDFVISTRVHQTIIAINNGIPAMCMNGDARAIEMMEYIGLALHAPDDIRQGMKDFSREEVDARIPIIRRRWDHFLILNDIHPA